MRIVQTIAALHLDDGGPSRSVSQLAATLALQGGEVHLVAGRDPGRAEIEVDQRIHRLMVSAGHSGVWRRALARGFYRAVVAAVGNDRAAVVHTHGLWLRQSHDSVWAARRLGVPVVLSPRGMLEPWAMAYRAWKKRIAWCVYQHRDLRHVTAFHATSEMEAESIRRLGFEQPIIVLPNGVFLPPKTNLDKRTGANRNALFLSRIHPKKGLDLLVSSWARVRPQGWRLTIAGNDDGGYAATLEAMIRNSGVAESIRYVGPAYGEAKEALYRDADLFVLPSHSENFGIVVAEALAWGVPVITTTGTPWRELQSEHCGWWIPVTQDGLVAALAEATSVPDAARSAMGLAGRHLIQSRYGWPAIARDMAAAYGALLARDATGLAALHFVRTG
ncbi:MAG TPA: glycosyltransferase [Opitutaceae bacterium]|nr:glycosyltransferase [Opitutaceae bacterium]